MCVHERETLSVTLFLQGGSDEMTFFTFSTAHADGRPQNTDDDCSYSSAHRGSSTRVAELCVYPY